MCTDGRSRGKSAMHGKSCTIFVRRTWFWLAENTGSDHTLACRRMGSSGIPLLVVNVFLRKNLDVPFPDLFCVLGVVWLARIHFMQFGGVQQEAVADLRCPFHFFRVDIESSLRLSFQHTHAKTSSLFGLDFGRTTVDNLFRGR